MCQCFLRLVQHLDVALVTAVVVISAFWKFLLTFFTSRIINQFHFFSVSGKSRKPLTVFCHSSREPAWSLFCTPTRAHQGGNFKYLIYWGKSKHARRIIKVKESRIFPNGSGLSSQHLATGETAGRKNKIYEGEWGAAPWGIGTRQRTEDEWREARVNYSRGAYE